MARERDCNICIHHASGACSQWSCKMQTKDDFRKEITELVMAECVKTVTETMSHVSIPLEYQQEVTKQLLRDLETLKNEFPV